MSAQPKLKQSKYPKRKDAWAFVHANDATDQTYELRLLVDSNPDQEINEIIVKLWLSRCGGSFEKKTRKKT